MYTIVKEVALLLFNNLHEKRITEKQDRQNFGNASILFCNMLSYYTKTTLVFSQSDTH